MKMANVKQFVKKYKRPYVLSKIALSRDGKYCVKNKNIAISTESQRKMGHKLRKEMDAIMIGSETAIIDNPQLTVRYEEESIGNIIQPLRIVIDSKGNVKSSNLMKSGTLIITGKNVEKSVLEYWSSKKVKYEKMEKLNFYEIMRMLFEKYNVEMLMVEGGGVLQKALQESNLIDEYVIYKSEKLLPNGEMWTVDITKFIDCKKIYTNINDVMEVFKEDFVIVMDDEFRENEGDLIIHPKNLNEEKMTFLKNNTTGIICAAINEEKAVNMNLKLMVNDNRDNHKTGFTVSCDGIKCGSGVSSSDRLETIRALENESEIRIPGHIFPLVAKNGGLYERRGHTEAGIELCKLTNQSEIAIICELTNEDGTMMKLKEINEFANKHNIPIVTLDEILSKTELPRKEKLYPYVKKISECELKTHKTGNWKLYAFNSVHGTHKVMYKNSSNKLPIVRIHSECFTGEVLHSMHCDCGEQLNKAMEIIYENGNGLIIYPDNHEGRGIGFANKVKAYNVMENEKVDTYEANRKIQRDEDERNYDMCVNIIKNFGIKKFELLTENEEKIKIMSECFEINVRKLEINPTNVNKRYINVKKEHKINYNIKIVYDGEYPKNLEKQMKKIWIDVCVIKVDDYVKNEKDDVIIGVNIKEKGMMINGKNYVMVENILVCYDRNRNNVVNDVIKELRKYNENWNIV